MKDRKRHPNKNICILAALAAVIVLLLLIGGKRLDASSSQTAYVLCRLGAQERVSVFSLPTEGSTLCPIRQTLPDGTETENILQLTPQGFFMESSDCPNHDCVRQGEVTLANRGERVLQNSVICLPHRLIAELVTAEELAEMGLSADDAQSGE